MSSLREWAEALKKDGYEFVPDSAQLQKVATKYGLDKANIGGFGFLGALERQLESEWRSKRSG